MKIALFPESREFHCIISFIWLVNMSSFVSPVTKETITKLQYLLQNTLYTYAEIVSSLSPESSKEMKEELSNAESNLQVIEPNMDSFPEKVKDCGYSSKDYFISNRIDRLGTLNDQIQAHVDLLPDSSFSRKDLLNRMSIIDNESSMAAKELEGLFKKYHEIYTTLKNILDE